MPVLQALDGELVPGPVVQGSGERLGPADSGVVGVFAGDPVLEERADGGPVVEGPGVDGLPELVADPFEPFRGVPGGLPDQAQAHAGGGGAGLQLGVHLPYLGLGPGDEFVQGAGDLVEQVVLQDFAFAGRQERGALSGLFGEGRGEAGDVSAVALEDHVDDHDAVAQGEANAVSVAGHGVGQELVFLRDLLLHPVPGAVGVVDAF